MKQIAVGALAWWFMALQSNGTLVRVGPYASQEWCDRGRAETAQRVTVVTTCWPDASDAGGKR